MPKVYSKINILIYVCSVKPFDMKKMEVDQAKKTVGNNQAENSILSTKIQVGIINNTCRSQKIDLFQSDNDGSEILLNSISKERQHEIDEDSTKSEVRKVFKE